MRQLHVCLLGTGACSCSVELALCGVIYKLLAALHMQPPFAVGTENHVVQADLRPKGVDPDNPKTHPPCAAGTENHIVLTDLRLQGVDPVSP